MCMDAKSSSFLMSTNAWIFFNQLCWLLMKNRLAITQLAIANVDLATFSTQMGPFGNVTILDVCLAHHYRRSPLPLTNHPYVIDCSIGKKLSKMAGN